MHYIYNVYMYIIHTYTHIYAHIYKYIHIYTHTHIYGLPQWLNSKESACNARDTGEEGVETHSSILAWRSPMNRGTTVACRVTVHGVAELDMTEATEHAHIHIYIY